MLRSIDILHVMFLTFQLLRCCLSVHEQATRIATNIQPSHLEKTAHFTMADGSDVSIDTGNLSS